MVMPKWLKVVFACLFLAVIIFGIVACSSYIPRRVRVEISALELLITDDGEFEVLQTLDIRIDGRLHNGMFASNARFSGIFEICEYLFPENSWTDIWFRDGFTHGSLQNVSVGRDINRTAFPVVDWLGTVHTDRRFSSIAIQIMEWENSSGRHTNRVIVAPATCAETARIALEASGIIWEDGAVFRPWTRN